MGDDLSLLIENAHDLMSRGKFSAAVFVFQEAIKHPDLDGSDKSQVYNNIGLCYLKLGDSDEAHTYFNVALRFDLKNFFAFYNKGLLHETAGELESAIEDYDKAIDIQPDFAQAYNNKGICLAEGGALDDALECFKTAFVKCPDDASYTGNIGKLYLMQNNPEKALHYFVRQICIQRKNSDAFVNVAQCYSAKSDYRRAIKAVQFAIKFDEHNADAYWEMGGIMLAVRSFSQAVIDYTKALKLMCAQKRDDCEELLEQLSFAVEQSAAFKQCAQDCSYAKMGAISNEKLVERLESAISEFKSRQ